MKRCETWQIELDKRLKANSNPVPTTPKSRPKTGKTRTEEPNPADDKIIKELQKLINKQEQLLRGIAFLSMKVS